VGGAARGDCLCVGGPLRVMFLWEGPLAAILFLLK